MVKPHPDRRLGASKFGCLGTLAVLVLLLYVGILFGRPWFRYQRWNDEIRTVAGFASAMPDSAMRARLESQADSLSLPPAAKRKLTLKRLPNPPRMEIRSEYSETVTIPFLGEKVLTFKPFGESSL
ncbi:MAG TPA: hypothetical protein VFN22_13510 [Gemmatimonadales bacterium]|nr:hypothetical protein [Gemmatimonadales bacterium]